MSLLLWPLKLLRSLVVLAWKLLVLGTCVFTITGFYGGHTWLADLTSHFRIQYLTLQFSGLVYLVFLSRRPKLVKGFEIILVGLCMVLNLQLMLPYYMTPRPDTSLAFAGKIKILHVNVLKVNRQSALVIDQIKKYDPDILALAEYSEWWQDALKASGVLKAYPHYHVEAWGDNGFYSKKPFKNFKTSWANKKLDATLSVDLNIGNRPVTLVVAHPRPPASPTWLKRQTIQIDQWTQDFKKMHPDMIVVGDLNMTPWSYNFQRLIRQTGLRDSQLGFGLQPSWPMTLPLIAIPIDHVLVSPDFVVLKRETGSLTGSDHLPVFVELGLKSSSEQI